jgi:uncharacterized protein YndB with AHSA1/START domain
LPSIDIGADMPSDPERVFEALTAAERYEHWVTGHEGWPEGIPALERGGSFSQRMKFMRWSTDVEWTIEELQPPSSLVIAGNAPLGVKIRTCYELRGEGGATSLRVTSEFSGGPASGPMRRVITRQAQAAVEESFRRLAALLEAEQGAVAEEPAEGLRARVRRRTHSKRRAPARGRAPAPELAPEPAPAREDTGDRAERLLGALHPGDAMRRSLQAMRRGAAGTPPAHAWRMTGRVLGRLRRGD